MERCKWPQGRSSLLGRVHDLTYHDGSISDDDPFLLGQEPAGMLGLVCTGVNSGRSLEGFGVLARGSVHKGRRRGRSHRVGVLGFGVTAGIGAAMNSVNVAQVTTPGCGARSPSMPPRQTSWPACSSSPMAWRRRGYRYRRGAASGDLEADALRP